MPAHDPVRADLPLESTSGYPPTANELPTKPSVHVLWSLGPVPEVGCSDCVLGGGHDEEAGNGDERHSEQSKRFGYLAEKHDTEEIGSGLYAECGHDAPLRQSHGHPVAEQKWEAS